MDYNTIVIKKLTHENTYDFDLILLTQWIIFPFQTGAHVPEEEKEQEGAAAGLEAQRALHLRVVRDSAGGGPHDGVPRKGADSD